MRITNNMLMNNMMLSLSNNLSRTQKYLEQSATGKKISMPSDDPIVASKALKLRTDVAEIEQYQRNTDDATAWMDITEATMGQITDVVQRMREITVQAANGTNTPDDLTKISAEASQLKEQLVNLGNATYSGRYIFSGYKTDKPLLNDDGTFNVDIADSEKIKFEIGIGDDINVNVTGSDLFNNGADAVAGGTSSFVKTFDSIVTAMNTNDKAALSTQATVKAGAVNIKGVSISGALGSEIINGTTVYITSADNTGVAAAGTLPVSTGANLTITSTAAVGTAGNIAFETTVGTGESPTVSFSGGKLSIALGTTATYNTASNIKTLVKGLGTVDGVDFSGFTVSGTGGFAAGGVAAAAVTGGALTGGITANPAETLVTFSDGGSNTTIVAVADTATSVAGTGDFSGLSFTTDDVTTASGTIIEINNLLGDMDKQLNNLLRVRAGLGARMNRVELTANRLADDNVNFTALMSKNEDVDMAEAIMNYINELNVYKASLSTGAKVIQPSLVDFLS